MKRSNILKALIFSILTLFITPHVSAEEEKHPTTFCRNDGNVRRVVIIYYQKKRKVPCQVLYYKDTEAPGSIIVLAEAANSIGYCEKKAQRLVKRLSDWHWKCEGDIIPPPEEEKKED